MKPNVDFFYAYIFLRVDSLHVNSRLRVGVRSEEKKAGLAPASGPPLSPVLQRVRAAKQISSSYSIIFQGYRCPCVFNFSWARRPRKGLNDVLTVQSPRQESAWLFVILARLAAALL